MFFFLAMFSLRTHLDLSVISFCIILSFAGGMYAPPVLFVMFKLAATGALLCDDDKVEPFWVALSFLSPLLVATFADSFSLTFLFSLPPPKCLFPDPDPETESLFLSRCSDLVVLTDTTELIILDRRRRSCLSLSSSSNFDRFGEVGSLSDAEELLLLS